MVLSSSADAADWPATKDVDIGLYYSASTSAHLNPQWRNYRGTEGAVAARSRRGTQNSVINFFTLPVCWSEQRMNTKRLPLSLPFLFPFPPVRSRPFKYSHGVWGSAVWERTSAEIEFGVFSP